MQICSISNVSSIHYSSNKITVFANGCPFPSFLLFYYPVEEITFWPLYLIHFSVKSCVTVIADLLLVLISIPYE